MKVDTQLELYKKVSNDGLLINPPLTFCAKPTFVSLQELLEMLQYNLLATKLKRQDSLYFNVPFCFSKRCRFCMYRSKTDYTESDLVEYVSRINQEIELRHSYINGPIRNVYIGGGTPTVLSASQLHSLLFRIQDFGFEENGERTCEMSPATGTEEHVSMLYEVGINRLSLGVQSFDHKVLESANRDYVPDNRIATLVNCARAKGYIDINLDLMFGLPNSTIENVCDSIRRAIQVGAYSISIYNYRKVNRASSNDDVRQLPDLMKQQFLAARDVFSALGWELYAGDENTEYHLFYSPERMRGTYRYQTSPNCVENQFVHGLGLFANGFSPAVFYTNVGPYKGVCMEDRMFKVYQMDKNQQIRLGAANFLYSFAIVLDIDNRCMV